MAYINTIKTNLKKILPAMFYPEEPDENTGSIRHTQFRNIEHGNAMTEAEEEAGRMWKREQKFYYWHP